MGERPCKLGDFKGWVTLRKILGWRVTFRANIYGLLDGEWLYYNFAAESFHTKKLCSRLFGPEVLPTLTILFCHSPLHTLYAALTWRPQRL